MITTVTDYRRDVLGIRFKGPSSKANLKTNVADIVFFADLNDYKLQKPMVDKISSLFKESPLVLTAEPTESFETKVLFVFGPLQAPNSIKAEDSFSFRSFSDISQGGDLKRELWEKLKKYT